MIPPATETAELSQVTAAECQQKNSKPVDHMAQHSTVSSAFDSRRTFTDKMLATSASNDTTPSTIANDRCYVLHTDVSVVAATTY